MSEFDAIEAIHEDVNKLYEQGINAKNLVYLTHPVSLHCLDARLGAGLRQDGEYAFRLFTACGEVEVLGDKWHPTGSVRRMYRCACRALFVDNRTRSGKCATCLSRSIGGLQDWQPVGPPPPHAYPAPLSVADPQLHAKAMKLVAPGLTESSDGSLWYGGIRITDA